MLVLTNSVKTMPQRASKLPFRTHILKNSGAPDPSPVRERHPSPHPAPLANTAPQHSRAEVDPAPLLSF